MSLRTKLAAKHDELQKMRSDALRRSYGEDAAAFQHTSSEPMITKQESYYDPTEIEDLLTDLIFRIDAIEKKITAKQNGDPQHQVYDTSSTASTNAYAQNSQPPTNAYSSKNDAAKPRPQQRSLQLQPYTSLPKSLSQSSSIGYDSGEVFTGKEITEFYNDLARGKYKGRETLAKDIDNRILLAMRDGRIVE
ncbi:hypothetical protein MCHI_003376 [Candidatus Magnetoovum chiemensis]|nr:hypothetical protein MCHI_003376 [Candidatus Magnetoovum chiemensis]